MFENVVDPAAKSMSDVKLECMQLCTNRRNSVNESIDNIVKTF